MKDEPASRGMKECRYSMVEYPAREKGVVFFSGELTHRI